MNNTRIGERNMQNFIIPDLKSIAEGKSTKAQFALSLE
jgi:hypothetical protein